MSEFWDVQAKDWDSVIANPNAPHYYYYRTADFYIMDLVENAQILLEVGCGTADCSTKVVKPSQTIIVTDYSRGMIKKTKQNISEAKLNMQILPLVCDAQMLPFKEESFDVVFSRGALLSYAEDPLRLLVEGRRVLKNGGVIGLDAMNYGDWAKELEGKMRQEISKMGGTIISEQKEAGVIYLFIRQYAQNKRLVGERRVLKKGGEIVQLFQKHQKEGHKEPFYLKEKPRDLEKETMTSEISYRRFFEPEELRKTFEEAGYTRVKIHPLGCLCSLMSLPSNREQNRDLTSFVERNRDWFCKLEKALSGSWKLDAAWHLFIKGTKE